jgi:16S rRNA (cytosine967-C5)-methyltransferase
LLSLPDRILVDIQVHAANIIQQVFSGASLTRALDQLPQLPGRAAIQDLSYGVLRHYGLLSSLLAALLTTQVKAGARALVLVGLYQLTFTRAKHYAVVDSAVEAARTAAPLVNAVLRRYLREKTELIARARETEFGRYSYPQWWIERIKAEYPETFPEILDAGNQHPPLTLRVNVKKISVAEYLRLAESAKMEAEYLGESAVRIEKPVTVQAIPGFADGLVSVHDAGAQFAARLLDVADGMRVLDACAAPGGKTAHLLELAELDLVALDYDAERLRKVQQNLDRLQLSARLICGDAAVPEGWWEGKLFDRILLDAPCTASGVVRRHPDIKWLRREEDIAPAAAEQRRLLDALWQILPHGGKLLYATCSVFAEENSEQTEGFLKRHDDAELLPLANVGSPQLLPNDKHDGFYYALLQKSA